MRNLATIRTIAVATAFSLAGWAGAQSSSTGQGQGQANPASTKAPATPVPSSSAPQTGDQPPVLSKPAPTRPGTTAGTAPGTDVAGNPQDGAAPLPQPVTEKDAKDSDKDKDKKKLSKKDDVDEIGNRSIGGRGLGNWYSIDKEVRIGKQYAQQVEQTVKLIDDPVVNEYVNRVGQNIVRNSDCKVPFTIKVVDDDSINAFALPGGFFYVNSGLILAADNESELAGVMAHETAHVCAHHAMRQMTRSNWAQIGSIPLMVMGGGIGYAAYEAYNIAVPLTFMQFSRNFESEADFLGVEYMYKAGYDPQSFIDFFEKVQAQEKKKPNTIVKAFSSHPQTPDRIEKSQEEIARILPSKAQYVVTTSEFDTVKARLARIENKRKLKDDKDSAGRPTLRRASVDQNGNKTEKDDGAPTLHRRDQQQ